MRILKWASLLLVAAPLLQGCKGFWDTPPNTGGGGSTASGGIFYVLNQKTTQVAGYSIVKGAVTAVSGSPYTLGALPFALTISPNNNYLYVSTAAGIYIYNIGSSGALTIGNSGGAISGDPAYSMAVDPSGSWLIEAVSGTGALNAIPLDSTTGLVVTTASEKAVTLPSTSLQQLAVSPGTSAATPFVFVAMGSGGTAVVPFTAGNSDPFGTVATIKVKNSSGGANALAVDPSNRLLYIGETVASSGTQTGGLRVFTVGTTLTEISGSPYATAGTGPSAIVATADNVYVANRAVSGSTSGNITGYSITTSGSTYSLTTISTVGAGTGTSGIAEENTGTFVLAVNSSGSPDLNAYTFDTTTTGKLDSAITSATGTDPVTAVAIAALH